MMGLVLRSGRAGVSKLMGRWSLCSPQLAGECKARQTPGLLEEANPDYTKTLQQGKLGNPILQWLELRISRDPGEVPG